MCDDSYTMALGKHAIRLELLVTEDSLSGRASDPCGASREFVGWVGLVAAIDALVRGGAPAEALDAHPDDRGPQSAQEAEAG